MEDDSVAAFDDTVDERFYDERRERAQRRQRKRYHAVYVPPRAPRAYTTTAAATSRSMACAGTQLHTQRDAASLETACCALRRRQQSDL